MASPRPRSMYTEDKLSPAVAAATTLGEVPGNLGLEDQPKRRRYVSERIKALGIDGSHLRNASLLYTSEMLAAAVADSVSMVEVAKRLGATPVGGTLHHLRGRVDRPGLDTSHFHLPRRSQNTLRPRPSSAGFRREGRRLVVDEQLLREVVPHQHTIAAVIHALGLEVSGPRHRAVREAIARLGLDVSHFRGQGHLRGTVSMTRLAPEEILRFRPEQQYRCDSTRVRRDARGGCPGGVRHMRYRPGVVRAEDEPGDRPRQRRLPGQPPGEPQAPVPGLPCDDGQLLPPENGSDRISGPGP